MTCGFVAKERHSNAETSISGPPEVLHVTLGQPWSVAAAGRLVVIWTG
jgi:hypothetical protein